MAPRPDRATVLLPPEDLRIYLSNDPCTAAEALDRVPGAVVALDGPMFENCDQEGRPYATSRCGDPEYLLYDGARGLYEPSQRPSSGGTLAVVGGRAEVSEGALVPRGATLAAQGYPTLVSSGAPRRFGDARSIERVWRAGFGRHRSGLVMFSVAIMSLGGFAAWCADEGGEDFFYTDGGGSGRLQWRNGAWVGSAEDRRVPSFLLWHPSSAPRFDRTTLAVGLALVAAGLAGAAFAESGYTATTRR